ncbi:hypothetical protein BT69DRAFT_1295960 [Atractiella rhizophila]|nr:hypothetical protein BT69DRAFT_1295960 [Atractiella rhizophila]
MIHIPSLLPPPPLRTHVQLHPEGEAQVKEGEETETETEAKSKKKKKKKKATVKSAASPSPSEDTIKEKEKEMDTSQVGAGLGGEYGFGNFLLCWGKERLQLPLPPPSTPLSNFRTLIAHRTGVLPHHQKLIFSGAVLKDDSAPLSAYHLFDDASADSNSASSWGFSGWGWGGAQKKKEKRITLIGAPGERVTDRPDLRAHAQEEGSTAATGSAAGGGSGSAAGGGGGGGDGGGEEEMLRRISKVLSDSVEPLSLKLDELEREVNGVLESTSPTPPNQRAMFLGETLLQGLIKLDSIEISTEFKEARKERKAGVKRVQDMLDRVDTLKDALKAKSRGGNL